MESENSIQRNEVYFVFLDPSFGREIGGYKLRPVVVMSINDIHQKTRIVAVVPGTTTPSNHPNVARIDRREGNGLNETTYFQCHQIRAIDQGRMTSRRIGQLSKEEIQKIEKAVRHSLGLF